MAVVLAVVVGEYPHETNRRTARDGREKNKFSHGNSVQEMDNDDEDEDDLKYIKKMAQISIHFVVYLFFFKLSKIPHL